MIVAGNILAVATLGILIYWHIREQYAGVIRDKGRHPKMIQTSIRFLFPFFGALAIAQLLGWDVVPITAPTHILKIITGAGYVLYTLGFFLSIWSRETLGRHWAHAADYQIRPGQHLVTTGPYHYIRHPIYTGFLLMLIGAEFVVGSWLWLLIIPLGWFVVWQSAQEEKLLLNNFGDSYRQYQRRTGMLLPKLTNRIF